MSKNALLLFLTYTISIGFCLSQNILSHSIKDSLAKSGVKNVFIMEEYITGIGCVVSNECPNKRLNNFLTIYLFWKKGREVNIYQVDTCGIKFSKLPCNFFKFEKLKRLSVKAEKLKKFGEYNTSGDWYEAKYSSETMYRIEDIKNGVLTDWFSENLFWYSERQQAEYLIKFDKYLKKEYQLDAFTLKGYLENIIIHDNNLKSNTYTLYKYLKEIIEQSKVSFK